MRINTNMMALNTNRQLAVNNANVAKSTEKLSSGLRINRAGDDAAGLAISEKMRAQIRGLDMASKNSEDAISLVQTAEGALTETHAILQRMRELAVQSSSDTNTDLVDRVALHEEFTQLTTEINDIAEKTKFNGQTLLDGNFGTSVDKTIGNSTIFTAAGVLSVQAEGAASETYTISDDGTDLTITRGSDSKVITQTGGTLSAGAQTWNCTEFGISVELGTGFQAAGLDTLEIAMDSTTGGTIQTGANTGDVLGISISDMRSDALGLTGCGVSSQATASSTINTVDDAINLVSAQRSKLGALQNRLSHKIKNLDASSENLSAAESRIRDLDMAKEMTTLTSNNILVQAATSMLAQANSAPQNVLSLLQ